MPRELVTVGDHLRAVRIQRSLLQSEVATILGVKDPTIWIWENNRVQPQVQKCGRIIKFLGYNPFPEPTTFAEHLIEFRRIHGLRVKDAAALAGVDPCSWTSWERVEHKTTPKYRRNLENTILDQM